MAIVEFRDVTLSYGGPPVLEAVNLSVSRGMFVGIVGPNGSGKTTLVRGLVGVLQPARGRIHRADGEGRRPALAFVPQIESVEDALPLTTREVVVLGRVARIGPIRRPQARDWAVAHASLADVGLTDLARHRYSELSGGQRQRALIARALASEPDLLALDEPTASLDLVAKSELLRLLHRLRSERGTAVVFVTHALHEVVDEATHIALLAEGRVEMDETSVMIDEARLSRLYNAPVRVTRTPEGHPVVATAREADVPCAKSPQRGGAA